MRIKLMTVRPWVNGSPCEEVGCESTCYDDCMDCMLKEAYQPALQILLKLWPADGSVEQQELLNRLKLAVENLNRNGKPTKSIQMSLFGKRR